MTSSYRQITDLMGVLEDSMDTSVRMMRAYGVPQHVIDEALACLEANGDMPTELYNRVRGYLPKGPEHLLDVAMQCFAGAVNWWRRDKITIPFDETLWQELGPAADGDLVSPDVFQYLPYPNPFIVFPQPIINPTLDSQRQHRVYGSFVFGLRAAEQQGSALRRNQAMVLCSTDDPRAVSVAFRYGGFITDTDGNVLYDRPPWDPSCRNPDSVFTMCALRFDQHVMTFGELARQFRASFVDFDLGPDKALTEAGPAADRALAVMRHVLAAVTYLCCSNRDLEVRKVEKPRKSGRGKGRAKGQAKSRGERRPPVVVDAGFQIGSMIRTWRAERENAEGPAVPGGKGGKSKKPHPRRTHMHRFRYGPGRAKLSQPRLVLWTWVGGSGRGEKTIIKPVTGS